jgi:hypothetical protein
VSRKQSQFPGEAGHLGGKRANREIGGPGGGPGADCAKQTQFAEKSQGRSVKCEVYTGKWRVLRAKCFTLRTSPAEKDRLTVSLRTRLRRAKQSQLGPSDAKGKYFRNKEL